MIIVKSANCYIEVQTTEKIEDSIKNSSFLYKYIPGATLYSEKDGIDCHLRLIINDIRKSFTFDFSPNVVILEGRYEEHFSTNDLITVIDYCLEYLRQSNGIYCAHGSAVSISNNGILILGSISGMGKTTLALNLCSKYGYKLIGDEKIILKNKYISDGVKLVEFNKNWLLKSIPENFNDKLSFDTGNAKLKLIIQPSISKSSQDLEIERWDELKTDFHLYEELTRKIRGVSRRIGDFSIPLPSLDNNEISLKRSDYSKKISHSVQAYSIKGNVDMVMDYINSLL